MSDPSAFQHPRFARTYQRISRRAEERGTAGYRDRLLVGLSGRVLEIGAGNGLNFAHYPTTVSEVVAVEPEDRLRAAAGSAARRAPVPVRVVAGHAAALPGEPGGYDAAVASLVLCSVPDQLAALQALRGMLRPGGQLRFFEHIRSDRHWTGRLQDAVTPLWSRVAGGCHLNRDTAAAIEAAGFRIEVIERFAYAPLPFAPAQAHILGRARKPG